MKRDDEPAIVSLETHRRRRVAETKAKAVKARKARPASGARGAPGEKAINWGKVPVAVAAMAALLVVSWLIGKLLG